MPSDVSKQDALVRPAWRDLGANLTSTFKIPVKFSDPLVEAAFLRDYGKRYAPTRTAAVALGALMWMAFAWWDYHHHVIDPKQFPMTIIMQLFACRAAGLAVLLCVVTYSCRPSFTNDRNAHLALLCGTGASVAALAGMAMVIPPSVGFLDYFLGVYLVLTFQFGFLHLRAGPVILATVAMGAGLYLLQHAWRMGAPFTFMGEDDFDGGMLYFGLLGLIGSGVVIKFERYERERYWREQQLLTTNQVLTDQNDIIAREQRENAAKAEALIHSAEEQRAMAMKLTQAKSRFIAGAAHDLRQPMFGLDLSLEAMRHALTGADLDETARLLTLAQRATRSMSASFNAVLDLSKLESGFVAPVIAEVDLRQLVEEVLSDLNPYAASRGITIRSALPRKDGIIVSTDKVMLERILKNLISNGIRYSKTPDAGQPIVLIGAVRLPQHVRIDVIDNGIGIDRQHWQRIFDPFVQLSGADRKHAKGLGLGLSIVNALIAILPEHRLEISSRPGMGSRFSLELPWLGRGATGGVAEPAPALALPSHDPRGSYVLLIDDDPLVGAAMQALFAQWGVLADFATGTGQLATLLNEVERIPDLIITDYRLQDNVTAHEVLAMLRGRWRRDGAEWRVPVLLVSGEEDAGTLGAAVGADAVLTKPVPPELLKSVIGALVQPRRH